MEKEFEEYWNAHRKRLMLNAPREMREEYLESTKLDTPMDWVCFVLPVAVGIIVQLLIVVVLFALLQMVKPLLQKKKTTVQVIEQIKQYYYERYKKYGLDKMEPWK